MSAPGVSRYQPRSSTIDVTLTLDPFRSSVGNVAASKHSVAKGRDWVTSSPMEEHPSYFPFSPPCQHCREITPSCPRHLDGSWERSNSGSRKSNSMRGGKQREKERTEIGPGCGRLSGRGSRRSQPSIGLFSAFSSSSPPRRHGNPIS